MGNRRALIVGINQYEMEDANLAYAVADAQEMAGLLSRHEDGKPNYECRQLCDVMEDGQPITRDRLREAYKELLDGFRGDVLFYFSGHGILTDTGGWIVPFNGRCNDWGIPMQEIMQMASVAPSRDILLILDCCYSGDMGNLPFHINSGSPNPLALIRENMTILAASHATQEAVEAKGHGLFTAAVLDALEGGAADHMGFVTAPSIYTYVERRFGAWEPRPVYKSNTTEVTIIRECAPLIDRLELRKLAELFPTENFRFPLDPEYEPEDENGNCREPVNNEKVATARLFKDYRDVGLLKPSEPNEQLYWTARRRHTVELTRRGREYWRLVLGGKI